MAIRIEMPPGLSAEERRVVEAARAMAEIVGPLPLVSAISAVGMLFNYVLNQCPPGSVENAFESWVQTMRANLRLHVSGVRH